MTPNHLRHICCEVTLFNRQRWKLSNRIVRRIIVDSTGKSTVILTKKLATKQDFQLFFSQVKTIFFDGKIIANRGCSNQDLMVSNIVFSRMKRRQDLLIQARKAYKVFKKQEKQSRGKQNEQIMNKKCIEVLNGKNDHSDTKKKEGRHENYPILLVCPNCFSCGFVGRIGFRTWN